MTIESINAITLSTRDMRRAVSFYRALGFVLVYGGEEAAFSSLKGGSGFVNLTTEEDGDRPGWWGRVIFHVADVDAMYERIRTAGYRTDTTPRDAEWGERYFHITDPDGHELSFARPLSGG